MKTHLALALLAVILTALPANGAANRWTPSKEQRSRQPHGPDRVPPDLRALPLAQVRPPYGSPGFDLTPLPFPYQRPWVN
jgi:hypothetical protein